MRQKTLRWREAYRTDTRSVVLGFGKGLWTCEVDPVLRPLRDLYTTTLPVLVCVPHVSFRVDQVGSIKLRL